MNGTIAKNSILAVMVHTLAVLAIILAPLPQASAARLDSTGRGDLSAVPQGLSAAEWEAVQGLIRQAEYQLTWHEPSDAYTAPNRANGLRLAFGAGGVQVRSSDPAQSWTWSLALTGYGVPGAVRPLSGAPGPAVEANRAAYRWDSALAEWYVNDERGLEQGFTIAAPPAAALASQVALEMALETDLVPQLAADAQSIAFRRPAQAGWQSGAEVLRYDGLRVSDGVGRRLPARLELEPASLASRLTPHVSRSTHYVLRITIDATSAAYPITVDPLVHSQVAKLTASDAQDDDRFGHSVAVSGDTVVVGAYREDGAGDARGAAYVYTRNRSGGADNWGQVKKLTASDAEDGDIFGYSVAISGDTVVVGAVAEDSGGSTSGAAYVFARNYDPSNPSTPLADNWGEVQKLIASDAEENDQFGESVAISGDTVVVGAYLEDGTGNDRGAAYVYARNKDGADAWGEVKKLAASGVTDYDYFGISVAISGDIIIVGARGEDGAGNYRGAAYVFARNTGGADNWGGVQKLTASDAADYDQFGESVAISGDMVVVGTSVEDGTGSDRGAAYVFARNRDGADHWGEVKKLTASDTQDDDWFGYSVAISGDTVVVGAAYEDGTGSDRGAAYVYARNSGGADNWGEVQKLTASDAADGDLFGFSVAISGDTVVVGAYLGDGTGSDRGAAYTFVRLNGAWQQAAKPTASDAQDDDLLSTSVAISGDAIVVGAPGEDGTGANRGAVYVCTRNCNGADAWGQVKKLTASDAQDGDEFGRSIAISGDTVVVGAPWENGAGSVRGAAYVYARNTGGADAWGQVKKLAASDTQDYDAFGYSVAISGDTVVVGASTEDGAGTDCGAAYVYARNSGGADNWGQVKKLTASGATNYDYFGNSVAISSDTIVVGAYREDGAGTGRGAAYVYARNSGGADNWGEVQKLTASDPEDDAEFAFSVAISGDIVVVGAPWEDGAGTERGAAYVYTRNSGGADHWGQVQKLAASDAEDIDCFGTSVAISGGTIVVGAPYEDGAGSGRGAAYIYARNRGGADAWGEVEKLTTSDAQNGDYFGRSVAISGGTLVVGAPYEDGGGTDRGAAYVFTAGPHLVYLPLVVKD
jgi:hypothetical protein